MDRENEQRLLKTYSKGSFIVVQLVGDVDTRCTVKLTEDCKLLLGGWALLRDKIVRVIIKANYWSSEAYVEDKLINISSDEISSKFEANNKPRSKYVIIKFESIFNYSQRCITDSRYYVYQQVLTDYKYLNVGDKVATRCIKPNGNTEYGIAFVVKVCDNINLQDINIFSGDLIKW